MNTISYKDFISKIKSSEIDKKSNVTALFYGFLERNNLGRLINKIVKKQNVLQDTKNALQNENYKQSRLHKEIHNIYIYRELQPEQTKSNKLENYYQIGKNNRQIEVIADLLVKFLQDYLTFLLKTEAKIEFNIEKLIKDNVLV